jgi:hypothetical protein
VYIYDITVLHYFDIFHFLQIACEIVSAFLHFWFYKKRIINMVKRVDKRNHKVEEAPSEKKAGKEESKDAGGEKKKKKEFRPKVTYSQPEYLEGLEEEIVDMQYDDYVQDLEVGAVYNNVDTRMGEMRETEWHILNRSAVGLVCFTLCVGGIFLVFIGRGETKAFQSQPRLIAVEVIGYLLCVPLVCFVMFVICPSRKEHQERKKISQFRKNQLEPYNESQIAVVHENSALTEQKQFAKRRDEYLAEERRIQAMKEAKRRGLSTGREVDRFGLD